MFLLDTHALLWFLNDDLIAAGGDKRADWNHARGLCEYWLVLGDGNQKQYRQT